MQKQPHLIIFRFSALGDVAMTVPVIRGLREQHPNVKITVVSRPFFKPLFDTIPDVAFYPADLSGKHKGMMGLLRLFRELQTLTPTAIADLHDVLRTKVLRNLFRAWNTPTSFTDKGRAEKKALTRIKNKVFAPLTPMVERHVQTFEKLGFPITFQGVTFPISKPLSEAIQNKTGAKNQNRWVAIAPLAQYDTKIYPLDLMREVVKELTELPNLKVFILGGRNEKPKLEPLVNNLPNAQILAGELSFQEELSLFPHFNVVVSMDSGNAHMAALFGLPVVSLWGHTHPFAGFVPFNQPLSNSLTPDLNQFPLLPTSIYGNKKHPGYEAVMRSIPPNMVVKKIVELL
ncbi:MAG: ADP-heptose--LPS heptosyltransferase RfaF [Flavobacterium sp. BFFFF2]|nr:MAG: ADP-heptose--LPS heptosyltransferase RfaF [Flavobacterium sp. BFFFF2]